MFTFDKDTRRLPYVTVGILRDETPDPRANVPVPLNLPLSIWSLPVVVETVHPEVTLVAEGGPHLAPALVPPSPPIHSHALDLVPAPTAAPAPTQDPGVCMHIQFPSLLRILH